MTYNNIMFYSVNIFLPTWNYTTNFLYNLIFVLRNTSWTSFHATLTWFGKLLCPQASSSPSLVSVNKALLEPNHAYLFA